MAKNLIEKITEKQINPNIPEFRVGDTVCVDCKIIEEKGGKSKERIQKFIQYNKKDIRSCFYHIGNTNEKSIFFISDVVPITDKYIDKEFGIWNI